MVEITLNTQGVVTVKGARSYPFYMYVATDVSNCKLSYIHGAGTLGSLSDEKKKEVIDALLKLPDAKGCYILNTTDRSVADFISKTYPVYYYQNVPIGYNGGCQYHICIKNTVKENTHCRTPKNSPYPDKEVIRRKLETILKAKRRKTDYIDEFIKSL